MLTKGYIVSQSTKNKNKYLVRIPFFEEAGNDGKTGIGSSTMEATVVANPGTTYFYQKDDCVFISFEDNKYHNPVILGLLYKDGDKDISRSYQNNDIIEINKKASLPLNTTIGDMKGKEIKGLFQRVANLEDTTTIRIPTPPSANGTYTLKCTVLDGVITYF